ncbi:MAG: hypothetical protein VXY61_08415 [Bacteroidota bacterium]|jgi:hypothetical protein|nr:hypothetical protein [Bacteroidota bacterium]MEC8598370.1 hypothetical protein [Bacteroidota bacterium]
MIRPLLCRSAGLLALAFLPLSGCVDTPGVIPYVDVQVDLNLSLPAYNNLNFPNNWLYISGGSRGLIVYRYTLDEFVVLDRHATWDVGAGCQCTVSPDGYTIEDPCSGSQWYIFDGSIIQGPTTAPLERYTTTWIPPVLSIRN